MAKILLVEDDNNLREIYEARLQAEGYTIVAAKDGEEALSIAKKEQPDLVISDVMMPRISGFEMLDILRNTEGLKDVRVIMLTALGQAEDKSRAGALGADRYLVKSQVTLEDIVKTAADLLAGAPSNVVPDAGVGAAALAPAASVTNASITPAPTPTAAPVTPPPAVAPPAPSMPTSTPPAAPTIAATPAQPPAPAAIPPTQPTVAAPVAPEPTPAPIAPVAAPTPVETPAAPAVPQAPVEPPTAPTPTDVNPMTPTPAAPTPDVSQSPTPAPSPVAPAAAQDTPTEQTSVQAQINDFINKPAPPPTNNSDSIMANAVNDMVSGTNNPTPVAPEPTPAPIAPVAAPTPVETPAAPAVPQAPVEPPTAPTPTPPTEAGTAEPVDDSVTISKKKIIKPIPEGERTAAAPADLHDLLAKEGVTLDDNQTMGNVASNPHQPGNVISPTPTNANGQPIDPNTISL